MNNEFLSIISIYLFAMQLCKLNLLEVQGTNTVLLREPVNSIANFK